MAYKRNYATLLITLSLFFVTNVWAADVGVSPYKLHPFASAPINMVKNPSCAKSENNITDANNILSRNTSSPLVQGADCAIDAATSGHYAEWSVEDFSAVTAFLSGQNCEISFDYSGDASLYKVSVNIGGTVTDIEDALLTVSSGAQKFLGNFPCGDLTSDPAPRITATDNAAAAIKVANMYIGPATNVGSVAQAEVVVSARRATTQQTISSTAATTIVFNTVVDDSTFSGVNVGGAYDTSTGVFTAQESGGYIVGGAVRLASTTASELFTIQVVRNSDIICNSQSEAAQTTKHIQIGNCHVYLDVGDQLTLKSVSSADTSYTVETSNEVRLTITRFPSASEQVFKVGFPGQELTSYTPSNTQGFGTTTSNDFQYQCNAGILYISAAFTSGTVTGSTAQIGLPTGYTVGGSSSKKVQVGNLTRAGSAGPTTVMATQGNTYVTFGAGASSQGDVVGTSLVSSTEALKLTAFIPVTADSPCPRAPMPLLKNAVTTSSAGVDKIARARITCSGSSSIDWQGGAWLSSIGNVSSGACAVNFSGTPFSSTNYSCFYTSDGTATTSFSVVKMSSKTTAGFTLTTISQGSGTTQAQTSSTWDMTCVGPN